MGLLEADPRHLKSAPRHEQRAAPKADQSELKKLRQEIKDQRALLEKPFADARREVKEHLVLCLSN
ncbi:MAG: hypothetical protein OSB05_08360 [Akkermansiaceae bacterium]|nr:hypothetical protein [Akkermansiaceae bacterium]